jgi:hypothetical protein
MSSVPAPLGAPTLVEQCDRRVVELVGVVDDHDEARALARLERLGHGTEDRALAFDGDIEETEEGREGGERYLRRARGGAYDRGAQTTFLGHIGGAPGQCALPHAGRADQRDPARGRIGQRVGEQGELSIATDELVLRRHGRSVTGPRDQTELTAE